ncbi:MAG: hypothetical protein B6I20_10975 [Bacteroidetes bacterium 4572_117]|nr:MAG: hypothetical protein B6I20_10975 [Bacteroidetes bacterium 4572_117]
MISKAKIKLIQSLKYKKFRNKTGLFVAEGIKTIRELQNSDIKMSEIFGLGEILQKIDVPAGIEKTELDEKDLKKISFLSTATNVLGLFKIPEYNIAESFENNFIIALDGVQDPGNLGTIIRLADWYNVKSIVCSKNCADAFNPKVIQSTMGSIYRVKVFYADLTSYLDKAKKNKFAVYGSFMDGETIYGKTFNGKKILVMGSEGNGISKEVRGFIDKKISIPAFFDGNDGPESLNVAVASAIIVSEMKRS